MLETSKISVLACIVIFMQLTQANSPSDLKQCAFNDSTCTTNFAKLLLKNKSKTGWPELKLIPFDPMRINSLILQPNPNSPISIGLKFKNIEILGLMNTQNVRVEGFTSDVKDPILLEGTLPQAIIRGPYEGSGTVLGLPFKGKGDCEIVLTNLKLTGHLHGKLINGYLSIDDVSLTMSLPDKVHFKFGGLFDGNKDLGDTANAFVNDNWREIFESMKDDMALAFAKIVKEITKTALGSVQYKELFKEQ